METLFVTESRELLFTGTEDIDVRPLHSPVLHYEGDSREVALRAAHEAAAASKVEACQRGFARWVATVSEITLDGEEFTESEETVNTVDPLDRVPELRTLAREAAARRADGNIIRDIAGHTEPVGSARCGGYVWQAQVTLCRRFAARPGEKHGRRGFHRLRRTRGHRRARRKAPRARR